MPLHLEARQERRITQLRIIGSIFSNDGADELRNSLIDLLESGQVALILDMNDVDGLDRAGVEVLKLAREQAVAQGGDVKLAAPHYRIQAVLALNDASLLFPFFADVDHAQQSFEGFLTDPVTGVRHFDILEFVKEQEKEMAEHPESGGMSSGQPEPDGS